MRRLGIKLPTTVVAAVLVVAVAAGCTTSSTSSSPTSRPRQATTRPVATRSPSTTPPTTTSLPDSSGDVRVSITGLPTELQRATIAYTFHVVLENPSAAPVVGIAPVFQVVAPPCNCIEGTLERQDPMTGVWANTPMPEGDGYDPASVATGPVDIPAGGSVAVALRLRVALTTAPKQATAQAFGVDVARQTQIGATATQPVRILP